MENQNRPTQSKQSELKLPGLDCGLCGDNSCQAFAQRLEKQPGELKRCIHLQSVPQRNAKADMQPGAVQWSDSLGRDFDFILDALPSDPGPREIILLHNPQRVKELAIQTGDIMIGRPMGMSCGCPITHCGVAMEVDAINGVIAWCVTGPLNPRTSGFKDLGFYSAQAYEGVIGAARVEPKIGMRYWFMPRRCMLQWRHSGLVNFINRAKDGVHIRVEGLFIG